MYKFTQLSVATPPASGSGYVFASLSKDAMVLHNSIYYALSDDKTSYACVGVNDTFSDTNIVILDEINGKPVTRIEDNAFYGCMPLTSVIIPDSVISIGTKAFALCPSLRSITIPDSVQTLSSGVFADCGNLESITLPFVGSSADATYASRSTLFGYIFGESAFKDGNSVPAQQYYDIYGSNITYHIPSRLSSVTITGGNLLYGAFCGCLPITNVTITGGVSEIADNAFNNCTNLNTLIVGPDTTKISYSACTGCYNLAYVELPNPEDWRFTISAEEYNNRSGGFTLDNYNIAPELSYGRYFYYKVEE